MTANFIAIECSGVRPPAQKIPVSHDASVFASPLAGERIKVRGSEDESHLTLIIGEQSLTSVLSLYERARRLNARPLGLMCGCSYSLLSVIIVHYQAGMNDSWDPAK